MPAQATFSYRVRDPHGEIIAGQMSAASAEEVALRLRNDGKYVVSVEERGLIDQPRLDKEQIRRNEAAKRIRRDDVIAFAQQLAVMLDAGVPLSEALQTFCRQTKSVEFRTVLNVLSERVCAGEPLSTAMAQWPRVFPRLMVSLMKASEASGTLAMMLSRVGGYLAKERKTAKQIKGALSYPLFMLTLGIAITVFLMSVVLPRFAKLYEQRSAMLPAPTRFLLSVSEFLTGQWMYYGPAIAALVIGFLVWRTFPSGRRTLDWMRLHVPILRTLFSQLYLTRATRTLSTLLSAGVALLDAIAITRGVTANVYWEDLWHDVEVGLRDGHSISELFAHADVVPANVASMIIAGDKAGKLPEVLEKIAVFSEEELDSAVKQTTAFIEPLMICLMGLVVGGVAIALLLPVFTIGNVMSGQG